MPAAPAACANSAALGKPPNPAIAALDIPFGTDPSQVGGTDIAPTNRAFPNSAPIPAPRPAPPPRPFIGLTSLTNFGASARPSNAVAPANPAVPALAVPPNCISGPSIMLAGCAATWATCITDDNGNDEANDCTPVTTPGTPATAPCNAGDTAAVAAVASPVTCAPTCEANPAKSNGGTLNGINSAAAAPAPA
ncbi:hypothetical protein LAUMK136_03598 [Mycobacterium attenuatum]|uniref:Uncharacterized protein n=1 Tax=Mycobacterium attenuatum TaxID=2341086 RepID=A0A498Q7R1_9MYCO|nr:hypothetical protein LAUMK136_03598 [Mycobacterium attenuatum]